MIGFGIRCCCLVLLKALKSCKNLSNKSVQVVWTCATVNNLRARQFEPSSLLSRVHNTFACVALWLEVHIKWVGCMLQHSALQHYSCIELCIYMDFWLQHDLSKILWTTIEAGSGHEVVCVLTWQLLFPSFLSLITERRYICEEGEDEGSWLVEKVHVRVRYDHILWLLVIFSCSQLQNLKQKSQVSFFNECIHFVNLATINYASVGRAPEAYGSRCVCVCMSLPPVSLQWLKGKR